MPVIPPMTVEEFFERTSSRSELRDGVLPRLTIYDLYDEEGGGFRVDTPHGPCGYGDTLEEAVRAAYDGLLRRPSLRSRKNPPSGNFGPLRIKYDYRRQDWGRKYVGNRRGIK